VTNRSLMEQRPLIANRRFSVLTNLRGYAPARESLVFLAFLGLTIVMTWPWVLQLRDAVPDTGDPYAISYFLWWDYHQTFHDPLRLFQATILYPYRDTLAFGEFDYGVSVIFFPLFVLGFRPLTVYSVAAFLSFPFTAYGTFRLARTLSGSSGVALVAGAIIAFLPFRFHHLSHLHLIFAGWIPLLFEALVLFARTRSWARAGWLGFAFLMNALTCTTWLMLTIIPLSVSGVLLLTRNEAWRDRKFWLRAAAVLGSAALLLLPFLLPLRRVALVHGFVRTPDEVRHYSAHFINWLAVEARNKFWRSLAYSADTEMVLFPGLMAPLLALAAFLFPGRRIRDPAQKPLLGRKRILLVLLDATTIIAGVVAILTFGYGPQKLRVFGQIVLSASGPARAVNILIVAFLVRCLIFYPRLLRKLLGGDKNLSESFNSQRRSELFGHAFVWMAIGFAGSFGLRFAFHRFLYEHIYVFRSMRVAARWAMICYLGLALLAGLGADRLAEAIRRWRPRFGKLPTYGLIVVVILFELNAAPLELIRGAADPDAMTLDLKSRKMSGGILELPAGDSTDHLYMLRAADHGHPLVNGKYSFVPPLQNEIEALTRDYPVPDRFIDLLELIPCSYLVVNHAYLDPSTRASIEGTLGRAIIAGRVRFIRSYDESDLYAIVKTEPGARSEAKVPESILTAADLSFPEVPSEYEPANWIDDPRFFTRMQYLDFLGREPESGGLGYWMTKILACGNKQECVERERARVSIAFFNTKEFQETAYFIYRVYKSALGRAPSYSEFAADRGKLTAGSGVNVAKTAFVEGLIKHAEFSRLYSAQLSADEFVDALLKNLASTSAVKLDKRRPTMVAELNGGGSRASVVRELAEDQALAEAEYNRAFVLLHYFAYLKRDPEAADLAFWVDALDRNAPNAGVDMVRTLINSKEYRARFAEQKTDEDSKQSNPRSNK
jgi:hypothetical protein